MKLKKINKVNVKVEIWDSCRSPKQKWKLKYEAKVDLKSEQDQLTVVERRSQEQHQRLGYYSVAAAAAVFQGSKWLVAPEQVY